MKQRNNTGLLSPGNISGSGLLMKKLQESRFLLLLFAPCFLYYLLFKYVPMWGVLISFKNYKLFKGFFASDWVGFGNFIRMFHSLDFPSLVSNTLILGVLVLICGFPFPIIFALILNEVRNIHFKKFVQTVSYMPYFMSAVIIVGMLKMFLNPRNGIVNDIIVALGHDKINFLLDPAWFRPIYIIADIWQYTGFGAIIYLAALSNIDVQIYESAVIDGANKWKQILYITLPSIAPVIIVMLLLNTGSVVDIGFEKVFLMQNAATNSTADVIVTYVYRQGLLSGNVSYGAAFGLFNSLINLFFIYFFNRMASRYSETSLW